MGYSPPGSSVHGLLKPEQWSIPFFRGSSQPRNRTQVSCIAGRFFTTEPPGYITFIVYIISIIIISAAPPPRDHQMLDPRGWRPLIKLYSQKPNVCNLDKHMTKEETQDMWEHSKEFLRYKEVSKWRSQSLLEKMQ